MPEDDKIETPSQSLDMEIFAAGNWHGDRYTQQDLQDIVNNFNSLQNEIKPFIKLGHSQKDNQPALGWIQSLRLMGEKIVASVTDIPQIVFDAIQRKLYNRVSSEIYWNYKSAAGKTYNYVLKAVALLGATVPEVKTLNDLTAYLSEQLSAEKLVVYEFNSDDARIIGAENKEVENNMADENIIKEYQDKLAAAETAKTEAENKLKEFEEKRIKDLQDGQAENARQFCEQAVKDGKMPPFVRDAIFPKDQPSVISFDENNVMLPFHILRQFCEKAKGFDFSERGQDQKDELDFAGKTPAEIIDFKCKKKMESNKMSYKEALDSVMFENPELASDYIRGGK